MRSSSSAAIAAELSGQCCRLSVSCVAAAGYHRRLHIRCRFWPFHVCVSVRSQVRTLNYAAMPGGFRVAHCRLANSLRSWLYIILQTSVVGALVTAVFILLFCYDFVITLAALSLLFVTCRCAPLLDAIFLATLRFDDMFACVQGDIADPTANICVVGILGPPPLPDTGLGNSGAPVARPGVRHRLCI